MHIKTKISRLILGVVFIVTPFLVNAQNMSTIPTFGVRGGLILSTVTGDDAIDQFAKKFGLQFGLTGAIYFHPMLSFRGELNYESKGGKFSNHEMNMNLNYLTLPLYLKFNFTSDPEIYIYGGGYGSYLLSANTKGTYEIVLGEDYISESINEDILKNMNQFDLGIIAGIGAQGRFNRWLDIFLDLRYTKGFINLDNNTSEIRYNFNYTNFWPEQELDKPKNKALIISTGFIYYLDPR
ncbi:MAG: PorT family protein [Bacteroidales bacterium]|nr:PorT family protein [Bacteroidales bacterium]